MSRNIPAEDTTKLPPFIEDEKQVSISVSAEDATLFPPLIPNSVEIDIIPRGKFSKNNNIFLYTDYSEKM